jgi:Uma2 family endonuclease
MPSVTRLYTVEDVRSMPDDHNRYETIAGELFVTPSPALRHQDVLARLFLAMGPYVEQHQLGHLWFGPLDVVYGPTTLVIPDLLFVAASRRDILNEREVTAAPDLVVEVLSPGTARTDRGRKRALYQETGVREYWIVDVKQNRVEIWRPGAIEAEVCYDTVRWQPDLAFQALTIDLEHLFRPLSG